MRKWLTALVAPILGSAVLVLGVIVLGRGALSELRDTARYTLEFAEISCLPPPGLSRHDFLEEVQFLSTWPDRLNLLDRELSRRLTGAFTRHPWVERVEQIEVVAGAVRVEMTYRTAVLAIPLPGGDGRLRAVDGQGVLLPVAAVVAGLPVLEGGVSPPAGGAGLCWGDPRVEAAAATASVLRRQEGAPLIEKVTVEMDEVWLRRGTERIRWGRPPGRELAGEAKTEIKVQRLLQAIAASSGLETVAIDLR